ncbi:U4/U6.U5 small nuclear ribonucleoprotein 27 kDa protein [Schistosoma japonicum]|uniref:U4/U6.U5 small nuclear ribonucleoprotein 27 kDa protein n=1 Tax=Schistosoma japonicum TaxID=6182 RepID=A0A4Z2DEV4_SCHJA|nr:U4/U6.U5 small nuclear ribonucleoprotein 27 kDa protein [Schistosoma japonicum]
MSYGKKISHWLIMTKSVLLFLQTEKSPRPRSHDRYRDHSDNGERSRKHRDDYHRRDRDHEYDYEERGVDRERYRHEKEKRRDRDGRRKHEQNHSERRNRRTRSRSPVVTTEAEVVEYEEAEPTEPVTEEEAKMMRTMGFCNFGTTKGKHVIGNSVYVANISKQRKYRQYMNRRGGFNSPLDPVA